DHQPVGGLRHCELIEICLDLVNLTAEIDGLLEEGALNTRKRIACPLARVVVYKSRDPVEIAERETLIDLRVDPDLRALPGPKARVKRNVPSFAPGVRREAVASLVGIAKRKRILADVRRLGVDCEILPQVRSQGFARGGVRSRAVARQPIIEPNPHLGCAEVRHLDMLGRARKSRTMAVICGEQIFSPRGPIRRDWKLDARANRPA